MMEKRRREPTVGLADAKRQLESQWNKAKRSAAKVRSPRKSKRR
jgi:hypothetical protein